MTNVSLSRPACASALSAAPSHTPARQPGLFARRARVARRRSSAPREQRVARRRPSARRARCRRPTARCSARRCSDRRRTSVGSRARRRASSRPEPGSVIATNLRRRRRARRSARTATAARSCRRTWRRRRTAFVSEVHRALDRADRRGVGRVEHVQPRPLAARRAKQRRSTSGRERGAAHAQQDDVFAGRRRAPLRRTAPARRARSSIRSAIVSQPRRLAISGVPEGPQSVASSRAILPATSSSEARASLSATAAWSASGMRASTVRLGSLTPGS